MRRADLELCECGLRHWPEENSARHQFSLIAGTRGVDDLWLSGDAPADVRDRARLEAVIRDLGVRAIVDVRDPSTSLTEWSVPGVEKFNLPVADADDAFSDPASWVQALLDIPRVPTLVHCHMGVNRSATAAAVMLRGRGLSSRDAVRAVLEARPSALAVYAPQVFASWAGHSEGVDALEELRRFRGSDRRLAETDLFKEGSSFRVWDSVLEREA